MTHSPAFIRIQALRREARRKQRLARYAHRAHLAYDWARHQLVTYGIALPLVLIVFACLPLIVLGSRLSGRGE